MKRLVALAVAATLLAPATHTAARSEKSEFRKPTAALRLVKRVDSATEGHFAVFHGVAVLEGRLVVEFDRVPDQPITDDRDTEGQAFFLPDKKSQLKLPAAIGSFYPREPTSIALDQSPKKLLSKLLGDQKARQILRGKMPRYESPAVLTIKSFSAWVECDHRIYTAEVQAISAPRLEVVAIAEARLLGC